MPVIMALFGCGSLAEWRPAVLADRIGRRRRWCWPGLGARRCSAGAARAGLAAGGHRVRFRLLGDLYSPASQAIIADWWRPSIG